MIGVLVNTLTVIAGSLLGLLFRKGLPEKLTNGVMTAIGLCTVFIGVTGLSDCQNPLIMILSMVLGAVLGFLLDLDRGLTRLGQWAEGLGKKPGREKGGVAEAFVTASLLFCAGAMTVVGSLEAGLTGDHTTLFTKSLLDLISSMMLAAGLGGGVMLAAAFVLVFQGGLVLLSGLLQPVLTPGAIGEMSAAGSLLILALGLNLLRITRIKVANYLPAIILAPAFWWLFDFLSSKF